jgi:hypothetical protein
MFERFTDRARKVLVAAQDEARLLGHDFIGTEHLLLGMLNEGTGVAAVVLGQLAITIEQTRTDVRELIGPSPSRPAGEVAFTPRAKRVLELALQEALTLGHNYIGTEHLLLALVAEGEGVGAKVLTGQGLSYAQVRKAVHDQLGTIGAPPSRRTLNVRSFTRPLDMVRLRRSGIRRPQADPDFVAMCSFCGKRRDQVERLVAGPGVFICDECVRLCVDIIDEEPQSPDPTQTDAEGTELSARCPVCSTELASELKRETIGAGADAVTVVHCGNCGTTIGVLRGENQ